MYPPDYMDLPDYMNRPLSDLPETIWSSRARLDGAHHDPERMRRIKALYYGKVSHVDACIGRLMQHLDQLDQLGGYLRTRLSFSLVIMVRCWESTA